MISLQTGDIKKVFYGQINYAQKYQIVTTADNFIDLPNVLRKDAYLSMTRMRRHVWAAVF